MTELCVYMDPVSVYAIQRSTGKKHTVAQKEKNSRLIVRRFGLIENLSGG